MFAAIDRCEFDRLSVFYTPDVVYERPGYLRMCGFAALDEFYRRIRIAQGGVHQLVHVISNGHAAACWGRFVGRSHDGRFLEERFADAYELREGRISSRITHFYRAAI
jgi:ketosteroid isomerase-like protein